MNDKHYKFTYENAEEFQTFPTNAVTLCHELVASFLQQYGDFAVPGIPAFDPMMLLHGEE